MCRWAYVIPQCGLYLESDREKKLFQFAGYVQAGTTTTGAAAAIAKY